MRRPAQQAPRIERRALAAGGPSRQGHPSTPAPPTSAESRSSRLSRSAARATSSRSPLTSRSRSSPRAAPSASRAWVSACASGIPIAWQRVGDGRQPGRDQLVAEGRGVLLALHGVRRELEEQRPVAQRRLDRLLPVLRGRLERWQVGVVRRGHHRALPRLHLTRHLGEQSLARPEVVDQHPVAGAHRIGDPAQARVADAVAAEVVDRGVEKLLARRHAADAPVTRLSRLSASSSM